jgi:hypothetical protein
MSQENVEVVRRAFEAWNSIGRAGPDLVDPEEAGPEFLGAPRSGG